MLNYSNIKLGKWDLYDLVDDRSTSTLANLVNDIKKDVREFEANRQILKANLDASSFEGLVHKLENISEAISTVNSFAQLKYAADTSSNEAAALVLETEKLSSQISNQVLFFDLWFKKTLDNNNAQRLIDSLPSVYREYLQHKRLVAKYSLNESEEKIINTLEVTGPGALEKIYDRMTNNFEFTVVKKYGKTKRIRIFKNKEKLLSIGTGAQEHTKGNLHTRHYSIPMKKIVGFSGKFTKIWLLNGEMKIFLLEDLNLLFQLEIFIIT